MTINLIAMILVIIFIPTHAFGDIDVGEYINGLCVDYRADSDNDGITNENDNCRQSYNPNQADIDKDGIGDVCDEDIDGDSLMNLEDACPIVHSAKYEPWCFPDSDRDGRTDVLDNCPSIYNPSQDDYDEDGEGDICDMDIDGDDIHNCEDNCKMRYNPSQADVDADGMGDECDDTFDKKYEVVEQQNNPDYYSENGNGCSSSSRNGVPGQSLELIALMLLGTLIGRKV